MKEIKLTQGKVALVDDEDYDYLSQWKWCAKKGTNTFYARKSTWDKREKKYSCEIMHRLIMNAPEGSLIDHVDHNGLNNQKANLRICTKQQNQQNRIAKGKSKYLGVWPHIDKKRRKEGSVYVWKRWASKIMISGKLINLGLFKSETLAALAYDCAARKHFKEFANPNFRDVFIDESIINLINTESNSHPDSIILFGQKEYYSKIDFARDIKLKYGHPIQRTYKRLSIGISPNDCALSVFELRSRPRGKYKTTNKKNN